MSYRWTMLTVALVLAGACAARVDGAEIRVLTIRVGEVVLNELGPDFERTSGHTLRLTVDLAPALGRKIDAGEPFDLAILAGPVLDGLITRGKVAADTRTNVLRAGIGVGVRAGAPRPDISTVEAFKRALLDAKSIAYLKEGASGVYLAGLLQRLGLAGALRSKTRLTEGDTVSELVAKGEVELGMVVIPNMMAMPGVDVVGPLPPEIQSYTTWAAGVSANAAQAEGARALIRLLRSPAAAAVIKAKGLDIP